METQHSSLPPPKMRTYKVIHPDAGSEEQWYDCLVSNPRHWWNNAMEDNSSFNGGTSPDFAHRDVMNLQDTWKLGLWSNSHDTPAWADDLVAQAAKKQRTARVKRPELTNRKQKKAYKLVSDQVAHLTDATQKQIIPLLRDCEKLARREGIDPDGAIERAIDMYVQANNMLKPFQ